jgi:hypothetical protein
MPLHFQSIIPLVGATHRIHDKNAQTNPLILIGFSNALATEGIGDTVVEVPYVFTRRIIQSVIQTKTGEFARLHFPEGFHEGCLLHDTFFNFLNRRYLPSREKASRFKDK